MEIYQVTNDASTSLREQIADLFMQQISVHDNEDSHSRVLDAINLALTDGSASRIIIAEQEGSVMGLAFLNIGISLRAGGHYIWLNDLYVHNEHRNKGIGRKLLLHVIYWAEQEGFKGIELETGISNAVTKHLYNSLDFHDIVSKRYGFSF